jgi:hypothetical protein
MEAPTKKTLLVLQRYDAIEYHDTYTSMRTNHMAMPYHTAAQIAEKKIYSFPLPESELQLQQQSDPIV